MAAQLQMNLPVTIPPDAYDYGERSSGEVHGVVLTKPHVVDLILDLAGYRAALSLGSMRLLEPACGTGAFLVRAAQRLLTSAMRERIAPADLSRAIVAFDIDPAHVQASRKAVEHVLLENGVPGRIARQLVTGWIVEGDFLLSDLDQFDFVVGNPPYVRIEQLGPDLHAEYRRRYTSLFDRADLYVAFIERGLEALKPKGVLSFVCADRWILNRYGAPLRRLVSDRFKVRCYVDLHRASPFESEVIAYPSIFAITPGKTETVMVGSMATGSPEECSEVAALIAAKKGGRADGVDVFEYDRWFSGDEPWVISSPEQLSLLRDLEGRFPALEDDEQTRVRIGVATGNDSIFIVDSSADIEPDRLVPLVMRDDIEAGQIRNAGRFVINTFSAEGKTVDLTRYPRLAAYFEAHATHIRKRHVAQKNPNSWFRTIDRVYPELVFVPKLLIPDIAGSNEVIFEKGGYHPHHNLYFVTSESWDMEVLGGLLSSKMALFFVWSYAVKMRGGYLRFQAQYLRRIRVPRPESISAKVQRAIKTAFRARNFLLLDELAAKAYGLEAAPDFDFVDTRT